MARLMDNPETFEQLSTVITNIACANARKMVNMSFEDLVQELWLWMVEKQPEEMAWATVQLKNRCIDLMRHDIRKNAGIELAGDTTSAEFELRTHRSPKREISDTPISYDKDGNERKVTPIDPTDKTMIGYENPEDAYIKKESSVIDVLDLLGERERKYVIARGYLFCDITEFEEEYLSMYHKLTDDQKSLLEESRNSDDVIFKVFIGLKTGTNSGTSRAIKNNIRRAFASIGITVTTTRERNAKKKAMAMA